MPDLHTLEQELRTIGADIQRQVDVRAHRSLDTGEHIAMDEDDVMPTASLIKVPVLVTLYQAVDDGRLRLDGPHHVRRTAPMRSARACCRRMSPGVEMTVRDAAVLMIIISDNAATNMCIDLVGVDACQREDARPRLRETRSFCGWATGAAGLDARKMSVSTAERWRGSSS